MPSYSSTARLIIVTHSPTSAFTSSGASLSPSPVEPTMSANRTVTGRSSSSRAGSSTGRSIKSDVADVTSVLVAGVVVEHIDVKLAL